LETLAKSKHCPRPLDISASVSISSPPVKCDRKEYQAKQAETMLTSAERTNSLLHIAARCRIVHDTLIY